MPHERDLKCRFCDSPAVAVFRLDAGCACHPNDREQALCEQHVVKATPIGDMVLIRSLVTRLGRPVISEAMAARMPSPFPPETDL